jgi:tetratricopeptide (TPR) repeat protein
MRRVLFGALICAGVGFSAGGLLRAVAAPDPYFSDGFESNGRNFGVFPGFQPAEPTVRPKPKPTAEAPKAHIGDEPDPQAIRLRLLDDLFSRLKTSQDDTEAQGIAGAIERLWLVSGSDTADLLMRRALTAENAKKYRVGTQILGAIVQIAPDWAEAWNELAISSVRAKNQDAAMIDIAHALAVEPRHFGAMTGFGLILMQSGDDAGALRVFRRVLELYPRLDPVRTWVDRLTIKVEGRDL